MIIPHHFFYCIRNDRCKQNNGRVQAKFASYGQACTGECNNKTYHYKDELIEAAAAFGYHHWILKEMEAVMDTITLKEINPYKQYELWSKYKQMVSDYTKDDFLYPKTPDSVIKK